MATLTSRTTTDNGAICAWVDSDGSPWIEQPFNPKNNNLNWESEEEASAWADAWITEYNSEGSN